MVLWWLLAGGGGTKNDCKRGAADSIKRQIETSQGIGREVRSWSGWVVPPSEVERGRSGAPSNHVASTHKKNEKKKTVMSETSSHLCSLDRLNLPRGSRVGVVVVEKK